LQKKIPSCARNKEHLAQAATMVVSTKTLILVHVSGKTSISIAPADVQRGTFFDKQA
jgi:hypothetical protein